MGRGKLSLSNSSLLRSADRISYRGCQQPQGAKCRSVTCALQGIDRHNLGQFQLSEQLSILTLSEHKMLWMWRLIFGMHWLEAANAPKCCFGSVVEVRRLEAASALQPPGSRDFKSPPEISCGSVPCSDQATHPLFQSPFLWYPVHLMINLLDTFWPAIERVWFLNKYFLFRHHDPHHLCEAGAGRPGSCHHQGLQCPAQDHIQDGFWGQWTASHPRRCEVPKICWDCKSQAAWWHSQVDHMYDAIKLEIYI